MSLNAEQRARTAEELQANLDRSGRTEEQARAGTGLDARAWRAAFAVTPHCRPEDVWLVRDRVEHLAREAGASPVPFTVLTEDIRAAASTWFPLR